MNYRDALNRKAQKTKTKENWQVYKRQKNHVNNIIKYAKINYRKNNWNKMQLNRNNFESVLKTCSLLNRNMKPHVQNLNLMAK